MSLSASVIKQRSRSIIMHHKFVHNGLYCMGFIESVTRITFSYMLPIEID